jgi:hypothetical protein
MTTIRPKKQYTIQLEDDVIKKIDRLAEKLEHSRSHLMRTLLLQGLEDAELIDKTGFFTAVMFSRGILNKFKEAVLKGKITLDKNGELKMNG